MVAKMRADERYADERYANYTHQVITGAIPILERLQREREAAERRDNRHASREAPNAH